MNTNSPLSFIQATEPVKVAANDHMDGRPIITPMLNKDGSPKVDNNAKPLGSIRLHQESRTLNGTFLNGRRRVAFIGGTIELLESIVKTNKLVEGSVIPGKIKIVESLEPMWPSQSPKMNPQTAAEVGVMVNSTFYPVYMQQSYTEDMNAVDRLIRTTDDAIAWLTARQINIGIQQQASINTSNISTTDSIDAIMGA